MKLKTWHVVTIFFVFLGLFVVKSYLAGGQVSASDAAMETAGTLIISM